MPYSNAMLHTGSAIGVSGTFEQTEEFQKVYKKQVDKMGSYIVERTTIDEKMYKRNKSKDWYLDAHDQVKYGIVDKIVENLDELIF